MATLNVPQPVPSPSEDAQNLMKAFKGWGTNEKAVISILGHRDVYQRNQIRQAYEELYGQNLIKRLESELSGDFERAMYRWIHDPVERDAILANVEVRKTNTKPDLRVIVELACARSPDELLQVKKLYQVHYKHSLEEDVASHFSGDLRKLLVGLVGTYRYNGDEIDSWLAHEEANILHGAIEEKPFGHGEAIRILTTRSKAQLNATFNRYRDEYGTTLKKRLRSDGENKFLLALRATIRCISSPHKYFEKLLREAMSKHKADEETLTRVIVTRAEKDLRKIKDAYYKRNNVNLNHAIAKHTSGDYKAFLLALLGD